MVKKIERILSMNEYFIVIFFFYFLDYLYMYFIDSDLIFFRKLNICL